MVCHTNGCHTNCNKTKVNINADEVTKADLFALACYCVHCAHSPV